MNPRTALRASLSLAATLLLLLAAGSAGAAEKARKSGKPAAPNSCVTCHGNHDFMVQNKKLFDYYQAWKLSIHGVSGVMCHECHGGNPAQADKAAAHGTAMLSAGQAGSPTSYQNVPDTCARCHDDVYQNYRRSKHFENLQVTDKGKDKQGPNCVTCHGSVNTTVLNVTTVRNTCSQCHNKDTGNYPEIPEQAEAVLSQFLSVHRYYRYIATRGDAATIKAIFKVIDPRVKRLNASWHTFDLDKVTRETLDLIEFLKVQRDQLQRQGSPRAAK
jgi:hypothetical protein